VEDFQITVQARDFKKKRACRGLRREGFLPAVVYHKGEDSISAFIPEKEFSILARKARVTQIFTLKSDDERLNGKPALVREIQKAYVSGSLLHVDFQALKEDEELVVGVALQVTGESPGVKNEGGVLMVPVHEVRVSCLPKNIPSSFALDISSLALGQSIHARDVTLPEGVKLVSDVDETLVSVVSVRGTAEGATTEAPAATPGAAPAAAAKKAPPAKKGK
jgi:large subunit ribosomal protein L25